jgi:hypothetical protein
MARARSDDEILIANTAIEQIETAVFAKVLPKDQALQTKNP